ncbi:MAG: hypothetical protein ACC682_12245 [Gemmatimonadota bacterium]
MTGPAVRHGVGLPVAMTIVMFGTVFAANSGRYGVPVAIAGVATIAAGLFATVKLFGSTEAVGAPPADDLSNDRDGENDT